MNRIKSVFIGIYPMIAFGIMGYSAWRLFESGDYLSWTGPLLTVVPFIAFLTRIMMFTNVARTSARFPMMNGLALAGVAMSAYAASVHGGDPLAVTLAALGSATFLAYSVWYSALGRAPSAQLAVGRRLPDLELKNADGGDFQTRDFLGKPALLFFYRGN